ncbi:MAG: FecR family protein, partial [Tannerellaceae bacterium]
MQIIDKHILIRYFLGQSPEEEKEAIHQWLESDEAHKKQFIRERIRFDASTLSNENEIRLNKSVSFESFIRISLKIAASILILVSSLYLYDSYKMNKLRQTFQCIHVPAGNRTHITLPDGTEAWLNANTTLQYPVAFSESEREVLLDGQAYFDVTKSKNPFIVKTGKYNVEVLGTTFDVEAYSKEKEFKTALFSGKVKLYNNDPVSSAIYLAPGQTAQLVGNALKVSSTTDVNTYRWREGLIYIEDKS